VGPTASSTGAESLARNGIRSPDRPARSESIYRLSYPGPPVKVLRPRTLKTTMCVCVCLRAWHLDLCGIWTQLRVQAGLLPLHMTPERSSSGDALCSER